MHEASVDENERVRYQVDYLIKKSSDFRICRFTVNKKSNKTKRVNYRARCNNYEIRILKKNFQIEEYQKVTEVRLLKVVFPHLTIIDPQLSYIDSFFVELHTENSSQVYFPLNQFILQFFIFCLLIFFLMLAFFNLQSSVIQVGLHFLCFSRFENSNFKHLNY